MRFFSFLLAVGLAVGSALAQNVPDYLKLRNQQHIVQPTPGEKLDHIVGPSVVEIQGTVQGVLKQGPQPMYIVEKDDKETLMVTSDAEIDWLNNGEVKVRMLIHVNKPSQYDPLEATLISAAPEADIAKVDAAYWKAEAAKAEVKPKAASGSRRLASRGDMYGWIGKARRGHRAVSPEFSVQKAYRDFVLKRNRRLGYEAADEIAHHVIRFSLGYAVDARLVMALIMVESDFRPFSTSRPGAMGLGQLMPGTASGLGVSSPYDLEQNLYGTIKLLRHLMDQYHVDQYPTGSEGYYGSLRLVLAGYNAGEGAVRKYGGVPPYRETQAYVVRVLDYYRRLSGDA